MALKSKIKNIISFIKKVTEGKRLREIADSMRAAGLDESFVTSATVLANESEGVADLFILWDEEKDAEEREEIIKAIKELLADWDKIPKCPQCKSNKNVVAMTTCRCTPVYRCVICPPWKCKSCLPYENAGYKGYEFWD